MAVEVVLDGPREDVTRALRRTVATWVAMVLLVVGLLASIPAVPATIGVVGLTIGYFSADGEFPPEDFPTREVILVWAISVPTAVIGIRGGLRLLRSRRGTVLFLRRFGHDEAREAVSYVVEGQLGSAWRVVTLDDQEVAPIGVAANTRRAVRAGTLAWTVLRRGAYLAGLRAFPMARAGRVGDRGAGGAAIALGFAAAAG